MLFGNLHPHFFRVNKTHTILQHSIRKFSSPIIYQDSRRLLENPQYLRSSWLKSVVNEIVPLTIGVINTKNLLSVENLAAAVSYCTPEPIRYESAEDKIGKRRFDDSWIEITLPFSGDSNLRETLVKVDGKSLRYGKLFEILDGLAGDVCYRHVGQDEWTKGKMSIVTASVDRVKILSNISLLNDVKLQGYLTYVGKSSMEVTIDVISIQDNGEPVLVGNTQFIMVARREDRAAQVPGMIVKTDEAKRVFEEGKQRLQERKLKTASSLALNPPLPEEMNIIHELYLKSKHIQEENELAALHLTDSAPSSSSSSFVPREKFVWMKSLVFKNTQLMHLQNRNIYGRVFGGWLMRTAYELGWVAATCYMGEKDSKFIFVDDIQFVRPVIVGSVVEFTSTIIYQQDNYVVVEVEAVDITPVNIIRTKTNVMHYIFQKVEPEKRLPQIMPSRYEEIVKYLEGKRSLDKFLQEK